MAPVVWTEREHDAAHPGWHDCAYCAGLMVLIAGGYDLFPEGIYTEAERELLESSDSRPDETGARLVDVDQAIKFRYGKALHPFTGRRADLRAALAKPGYAFLLNGQNDRLPDRLHRWDPTYPGGHSATAITRGDGSLLWLDPEATQGYPGDVVDIDIIAAWAWDPVDVRYLKIGELAPPKPPAKPAAVDYANQPSAFGTRYPSYVHTDAQALAWVNRNVRRYRTSGALKLN